ncbi:MAG: hypothetical protein KH216_07820, partial [Clostridiales bacterium]|nr:hypothetical protein [Clostridiales bacterium]
MFTPLCPIGVTDETANLFALFSTFCTSTSAVVNPLISIPYEIEELTHITDAMLKDAETIDIVLPRFLEFCEGSALVAHNADFDTNFIRIKAEELGID